ncbi:MAG: HAD family phosphatase [Clostridiales bacterium]|nr:HAD family phosphatase [Clostridiales bacterium]
MIKGAIFDMDGTVLDSMHLWMNFGPRFLDHIGVPNDPEAIQEATKTMLYKEMNDYFNSHGFTDNMSLEEFTETADSMAEKGYFHEVLVKPGVTDFLKKLRERNIPIALATATDRYMVEAALKRNGIYDFFDVIFTCNEVSCDKKVTTIYDAARDYIGTPTSETYVFEDTLTPVRTLAPTDYKVVGVSDKWSAHNEEKIRQLADLFVYNLNEIDLDTL